MASCDDLSDELIAEVVSFLPTRACFSAKRVARRWRDAAFPPALMKRKLRALFERWAVTHDIPDDAGALSALLQAAAVFGPLLGTFRVTETGCAQGLLGACSLSGGAFTLRIWRRPDPAPPTSVLRLHLRQASRSAPLLLLAVPAEVDGHPPSDGDGDGEGRPPQPRDALGRKQALPVAYNVRLSSPMDEEKVERGLLPPGSAAAWLDHTSCPQVLELTLLTPARLLALVERCGELPGRGGPVQAWLLTLSHDMRRLLDAMEACTETRGGEVQGSEGGGAAREGGQDAEDPPSLAVVMQQMVAQMQEVLRRSAGGASIASLPLLPASLGVELAGPPPPPPLLLERLPPTHVVHPRVQSTALLPQGGGHVRAVLPLLGLWQAAYGGHGVECIHVAVEPPREGGGAGDAALQPAAPPAPAHAPLPVGGLGQDGTAEGEEADEEEEDSGEEMDEQDDGGVEDRGEEEDESSAEEEEEEDDDDNMFNPIGGLMRGMGPRWLGSQETGQPTSFVGGDMRMSSFWGERASSPAFLPPASRAVRFDGLRVVGRKVVGDPNVCTGQITFVASLEEASMLTPADAIPAAPVVSFTGRAGQPVRFRDLHAEWAQAGLCILPARGQVNMQPRSWMPQWMPAALFVWKEGKRRGGGSLASGEPGGSSSSTSSSSSSSTTAPSPSLTFSLLWYDRDDMHHMTDFEACLVP